MKKMLRPWWAKLLAVIVLALLIYISKDEFMKGLAEGRAARAKMEAEKAANQKEQMKSMTR